VKRPIVIAALVAVAGLSACATPASSYAGTTTFGNPMSHVAGHYPIIIVQDDTSSAWPVHAAVASWGLHVTYGTCVATLNCVHIVEVTRLGTSNGNAEVGLTWQGSTPGKPSTILIQLANNPKMNGLQALQDVAHEFGHALGLGHDEIGVMNPGVTGAYRAPNAAELARLRSIYLG
jgi:hypothetical protein